VCEGYQCSLGLFCAEMYWVCCVVGFNISEAMLVAYKFILLENFIFMKIGVNFVPKYIRHTIGEMYFWDRHFCKTLC